MGVARCLLCREVGARIIVRCHIHSNEWASGKRKGVSWLARARRASDRQFHIICGFARDTAWTIRQTTSEKRAEGLSPCSERRSQ